MAKLVEATQQTGLDKKDLIVELDMMPDANGLAPALMEKPQFKILGTKGYYEGSRPNEPDWFFKNEGDKKLYEDNIGGVVTVVRDLHSRMTSDFVLFLVRFPQGCSCLRLELKTSSGVPMFGDQALEAFKIRLQDNDFDPFKAIFNLQELVCIEGLLFKHGIIDRLPDIFDVAELRKVIMNPGMMYDV